MGLAILGKEGAPRYQLLLYRFGQIDFHSLYPFMASQRKTERCGGPPNRTPLP